MAEYRPCRPFESGSDAPIALEPVDRTLDDRPLAVVLSVIGRDPCSSARGGMTAAISRALNQVRIAVVL
jgi:hypothetical protein